MRYKVSNLCACIIYSIYGFFALLLIYFYFIDYSIANYKYILIGFLISCTFGTYLLIKLTNYFNRFNSRMLFIALLFICIVVKTSWVLYYQIKPVNDYETFYNMALFLSRNFVVRSRYVALFPHIMGYSLFLSFFLKIFGDHLFIPPIINVILSTISMALLYYICKKLSGKKMAIIASILWIGMPSQTIYNMFALSEPFYCTVLMSIWALLILVQEKFEKFSYYRLISCSFLIALLLGILNMARPIALIPIIAIAIWLFLIDVSPLVNKRIYFKKTVYFLTIISSYLLLSFLAGRYIAVRLGEEPASVPGYSLYVGLNEKSGGTWNPKDSQLLSMYSNIEGSTAEDVQKRMLVEAKKRFKEVNIPKLIRAKFINLLADDSTAVSYADAVLKHITRFRIICNVYYYFAIFISVVGVIAAIIIGNKSMIIQLCLYSIGFIMAQLLVEVAGRYHYSIILPITILAAYGITIIENVTVILRSKSSQFAGLLSNRSIKLYNYWRHHGA